MSLNLDRDKFFSGYRDSFGPLNQSQTDGLNFLLDKLEQDSFSLNQVAYILATVDHETAHTFQPVKEKRERANSPRRKNQDRYWLTGAYGRGFVQITWDKNYRMFGLGPDERDKALEPETAYEILSRGMREGLFTGRKLSDFINDAKVDNFNARTVINGHDKAAEIAGRAKQYEWILSTSTSTRPGTHLWEEVPGEEPMKPVNEDKGVTTGGKVEESGTPPPAPAVDVKPSSPSLFTKIGSLSLPASVMTILAAIGKFVQGLPPWAWVAIVLAAMLVGYMIWRDSQKRAHERTLRLMSSAADKNQNNLRLVGTLPAPEVKE